MSPKNQTDLDRLQGTWRVTALEIDGRAELGALTHATITVRGSEFATRGMGDDYSGTIELVAGEAPNAFNLLFTSGPPAGLRNRGIYKLDGDTWTICLATRGGARPTRFATHADSGIALETLERATVAAVATGARRAARTKAPGITHGAPP